MNERRFKSAMKTIDNLVMGPNQEFNMRVWGTVKGCKTVACLAGWIALRDPVAKKDGLVVDLSKAEIHFDGLLDDEALIEYFDLPHGAINYLFWPHSYTLTGGPITLSMARQHMRDIWAEEGPE